MGSDPAKAGMFTWWPGPLAALRPVPETRNMKPVQEAEPQWKAPGSGNCSPREGD